MRYFFIFLCLNFLTCTSSQKDEKQLQKIIAIVGKDTINQEKWELRTQLLTLDSTASAKEYALFQLLKMYCQENIAKKYGYILTDTMLRWESRRIDSATLMPEKLQRIKEICKTREMYQEVFIKESLSPRWLKICFDKDEKQHRNKAVEANEIFTEALLQANLFDKDSCKTAKGNYAIHTFWLDENSMESALVQKIDTVAKQNFIDQSKKENLQVKQAMEAQMKNQDHLLTKQLYQLVQQLKIGQLHPRVIDSPNGFWIVKHCGQKGKKYKIKLLEIPKNNFSEWLEEELRQSSIQVVDSVTWKRMKEVIPTVSTIGNAK
jgi:hypothetical protein